MVVAEELAAAPSPPSALSAALSSCTLLLLPLLPPAADCGVVSALDSVPSGGRLMLKLVLLLLLLLAPEPSEPVKEKLYDVEGLPLSVVVVAVDVDDDEPDVSSWRSSSRGAVGDVPTVGGISVVDAIALREYRTVLALEFGVQHLALLLTYWTTIGSYPTKRHVRILRYLLIVPPTVLYPSIQL